MTTAKNIALTRWTFVGKVMSLLYNMLSRLIIAFFLRSKHLLISWMQSASAVILEPPKIKMVGWHHQLNGHEFEQALGVGDGQGSLACCSPWRCKESDMTKWLNWIEYIVFAFSLDLELYKKWISLGIHFFLAWTVAGATHTMRCRLSWTWHMQLGSGVSNYPI